MLQGADVAALTADDAALHILGGEGHDGGSRVGSHIAGEPLHGHGDDLAGPLIGLVLDLLLALAKASISLVSDLTVHLSQKELFGFRDREAGHALQLLLALVF